MNAYASSLMREATEIGFAIEHREDPILFEDALSLLEEALKLFKVLEVLQVKTESERGVQLCH